MNLPRILILLTAGLAFNTTPAHAKDHDWDKKHDKHSKEYYRHHRSGVTVEFARPRQHYYGSSSTVIIAGQRPSYYGRESYSGRSVEIDVQRGLARRGYYRGPIDGDIGPGSRASIRAFQSEHGFAATGRIDRGLLEALR